MVVKIFNSAGLKIGRAARRTLRSRDRYWIGQFGALLNTAGNNAGTQDSAVAKHLKGYLRSQVEQARKKPAIK